MEALDLAGRGRRARRREPVRDPVAPADLVEQHLAAAAEAIGELLAVIRQHLLRRAIALQRLANARQTARPVARSTTRASTQIARVIIDAGHDPRLAQLPRRACRPAAAHRRCPAATAASPPAAASAHSPSACAAARRAITRPWRTRIRCTVARDGNGSGGAGPRISSCTIRCAPHFGCARRSSHTRASTSADARFGLDRGRCDRSASPASPASRYRATHACTDWRDTPDLGRDLAHARAVQHRHHRSIPLLDDRQRHQRQSRPPVADPTDGKSRSRPAASSIS